MGRGSTNPLGPTNAGSRTREVHENHVMCKARLGLNAPLPTSCP